MIKCRELLKNGERSLVEVSELETGKVDKYVVCSNFDDSKKYGEKWDWGHYFDVWAGAEKEDQMKAATMCLYEIKEPPIPYVRLSEIATLLKDCLMEDEEESAIEYMKETCELTEQEAEYLGVKEKLYPTKLKVIEAIMKREQYCTIKIVMPEDKDSYNVDEYITNEYEMEPDWDQEGEWYVDDYNVYESGLDKEEFNDRYDSDKVWNYDDAEDM